PRATPVRMTYEEFKQNFGAEEVIIVAVDPAEVDSRLQKAVAARLAALPGIRECYTPDNLREIMTELGVDEAEAAKRLSGLLVSEHGHLVGLVALLSDEGLRNRAEVVNAVRREIEY